MTVIVNAGELRQPIVFQELYREDDGAGSAVENWRDFSGDRVKITPVSAAERIRSEKLESLETHVITGRYRSDVNKGMRIVLYDDRIVEITGIINVMEMNVQNQYLCREVK